MPHPKVELTHPTRHPNPVRYNTTHNACVTQTIQFKSNLPKQIPDNAKALPTHHAVQLCHSNSYNIITEHPMQTHYQLFPQQHKQSGNQTRLNTVFTHILATNLKTALHNTQAHENHSQCIVTLAPSKQPNNYANSLNYVTTPTKTHVNHYNIATANKDTPIKKFYQIPPFHKQTTLHKNIGSPQPTATEPMSNTTQTETQQHHQNQPTNEH
eukprot:gene2779-1764_t